MLQFHAKVLVYHLGALSELQAYHKSFPWRAVEALDPKAWSSLLAAMQEAWTFTVEFVDILGPKDPLFYEFGFTRYQSFRELLTCAEYLGYFHQNCYLCVPPFQAVGCFHGSWEKCYQTFFQHSGLVTHKHKLFASTHKHTIRYIQTFAFH